MFKIVEPQRGVNLLESLFASMQASIFRSYRMPVLADVFVFTYPVYLLALYIYGMVLRLKRGNVEAWKRGMQYKISAVFIFCGTVLSFAVNIFIQFFMDKVRPNIVLGLPDLKHETILNSLMPPSSFPSDHAALSMGIAFASIVRGVKNKDKKYLRFGGVLIIFSLITSLSRVTTAVHRPTDVIAGSVIGIIVPWILMNKKIYGWIDGFGRWIGKII